jgi:hypothetical protein
MAQPTATAPASASGTAVSQARTSTVSRRRHGGSHSRRGLLGIWGVQIQPSAVQRHVPAGSHRVPSEIHKPSGDDEPGRASMRSTVTNAILGDVSERPRTFEGFARLGSGLWTVRYRPQLRHRGLHPRFDPGRLSRSDFTRRADAPRISAALPGREPHSAAMAASSADRTNRNGPIGTNVSELASRKSLQVTTSSSIVMRAAAPPQP